ncbi:MAG: universal stress protein [Hyphomonas sp.]|nr:universal stress protein [Hyphomonas sp.]
MKIKDISVCMASPDGDKAAFDFAKMLAVANDAHLSCAAFTVLPPMILGYGDGSAGEVYASILQQTRDTMSGAWKKFEDSLDQQSPAIEMRHFEAFPNRVESLSAMNARHADIVVVRAPGKSDEQPHADLLEGVLLGGGRPVLIVPEEWSGTTVGQRAMIAWDASREATRALHDSLLLMNGDAKVCVATVDAKPGDTSHGAGPAWDVGAHLSRHVADVEVRNEDSIGRSTAEALMDVATSFDADLIVMGGYRHSRLQQAFLPGVTRTLLREAKVPLLLSH